MKWFLLMMATLITFGMGKPLDEEVESSESTDMVIVLQTQIQAFSQTTVLFQEEKVEICVDWVQLGKDWICARKEIMNVDDIEPPLGLTPR